MENGNLYPVLPVLAIQTLGRRLHRIDPGLQNGPVKIAQNIFHRGRLHIAFHLTQVIEPLSSFGKLGALISWKQTVQLHSQCARVNHLSFRFCRMDIVPLDLHLNRTAVEGLEIQLTNAVSVYGNPVVCAEAVHI